MVLAAVPALGQDAQQERAFLELVVNGVSKAHVLVVVRPDDALIGVETLADAGVGQIGGRREPVNGDTFVSLASLAPGITYLVDERELRMLLTVRPALLGRIVRDLQSGVPADLEYRSTTSLFTNYAITTGPGQSSELFTESALSARGLLFYTTATTGPRGTIRGTSSVTVDQRSSLRRWVVGDSFVASGPLGGDAQIAGVTVSREFSLAPYFVRHPTLSLSTPLQTESTVEVYVNGRLVSQEQVAPGQLDLRSLPLTTGYNDTRIVVRDPFGGTQEMNTSYYLTTSVLAPGLHDYQYSVGWRRASFGTRSWDYTEPIVLARHRVGITDSLTLGGRAEGDRRLISLGSTANLRLPIGEIEAAVAASRAAAGQGAAGQVGYMYSGRLLHWGGSVRHSAGDYRSLSTLARGRAPVTELGVFGGLPLGGGSSLTLQYSRAAWSEQARQSSLSMQASARLGQQLSLVASAARLERAGHRGLDASVGVSMALGSRTTASASVVRGLDGTRSAYDLQRSLASGSGVGYRLHAEGGAQATASGAVQYQGPYGRYEVRRDAIGGAGQATINASGAVVAVGGRLYASRAVRNSFALVRVPGVTDVRGFSSNQEIGRTDRRGDLLVPDLLPYYGNKLQISDSDIPLEYVVSNVEVTLAPPYRGGAVVLFPVRRVQYATGTVVVGDGAATRAPAFADLTVTAGEESFSSPIGRGGQFYFENLPAGDHPAVVVEGERSCAFTLRVPVSDQTAMALGSFTCE
jgi:outer membrane usher protein